MDDVNAEWRRLQGLYAGLGDAELLDLLRDRDGLTEVAQRAADAEFAQRGLKLATGEEVESGGEAGESGTNGDEGGLHRLWRFQLAVDAEAAVAALDEADIACVVKGARARIDGVGPLVDVPGLDLFVEAEDSRRAEAILQKKMKLFPAAESEGLDNHGEEEVAFVAGTFATEAEADAFLSALKTSGIGAEKREEQDVEGTFWNVEVAFDDLPQATEVAERMETEENSG